MECVNEPLQRCCFRCGETGHDSRNCKNEVCYNCFETGHIAANCKQARRGTLDVTELKDPFKGLKAPFKELEKVRCMTCDKLGHINFWVDSKIYNHIENAHQFLLLSLVDATKK